MTRTVISAQDVVVVANAVEARLFTTDRRFSTLHEMASLQNPDGRLREGDLVAGEGGQRGNQPLQGGRSALGGQSVKQHRKEEFAAAIAKSIARCMLDANAPRLHLIAGPEILGLLRRQLDEPICKRIVGEIRKDLSCLSPEEISEALKQRARLESPSSN